ncbi:MAG TPA: serine--tRNA ligase [Acidimicrobiales bacterium]|jgi:seryl-tRNA synthetase|nr:serine--tRNA ligase [Acidimicrobiales bacterium]
MLDVRRFRTELGALKEGLARKGADLAEVDRAAELDRRRREAAERRDRARAEVNALSKEVGRLRREGDPEGAEARVLASRRLGETERAAAAEADAIGAELRQLLLRIPNLPAPDAPDGGGAEDNVVLRTGGADPEAYGEHQRVPHWEVGTVLGILDLERGARLSGSMFPLYRGAGAALVRALTAWALASHADAFEEIRPPTLVRSDTITASGQLPKFADDAYHLERDDLWAIPTAEVPLTSMAAGEILAEADLPLRYSAATPCYRREAGSAGRDTRGLLRVHEFEKVELLAYCTPEQAPAVHAELLARAEGLLGELGLAYRVLDICTGDLGQTQARQFDLEVYAPGCDQWLEVSSVSWFGDYQARRADVRYRREDASGVAHVHTLNGSALAWPRIWAALIEAGRQDDGTVVLPEALAPWLAGRITIA